MIYFIIVCVANHIAEMIVFIYNIDEGYFMKKFFIFLAGAFGIILAILYLSFLFVLPNVVDLDKYLPELKRLVKEQTNVDLSIENPKISTNWLLQVGIKTDKVNVKLPDGSTVLNTDGMKVRISIPSLLLYTIKVSCADFKNLNINLDIIDGEQFKVVRLVENILNNKKNEPPSDPKQLPIELEKIKIRVPNIKVGEYNINVNDLKTSHKLLLTGEKLFGAYNHKETAKLKTNAKVYSDDCENITANLNVDTYIPSPKPKDPDDDPAEKIELPFINPVIVYRNYNLKSNINSKIRIRKNDKFNINGHIDVYDMTMNLAGYQLPKSYVKAKFKNEQAFIDTNLTIAKNQSLNFFGKISYGNDPSINAYLNTDKIYFNDMIVLVKAFLDTLHIKNNLAYISAKGYWIARTNIKTDFENLESSGSIIARDGSIYNGATKLVFDKIRANLIFDDNKLKISDTHVYINDGVLSAEGVIDTDSYSDIKIHSDKLPIAGLFTAFAPSELKKSISLTGGSLYVDAKLQGKLKQAVAYANVILNNLALHNKIFNMNDEKLVVGVVTDLRTIDGNITNKNFRLTLPKTASIIQNPDLTIKLNEKDISIKPANLLINSSSKVGFWGDLKNYSSKEELNFVADGYLNAIDLRKFAGKAAEPFIAAKGNLPIKLKLNGDYDKQSLVTQIKSDESNYITPVDVEIMGAKQSILQAKVDHKKDRLHIKQTGFYTGATQFSNDLESNMGNTHKIAELSGTIVKLNTANPFINLIKLDIPQEINAKFTAFKNSRFKLNGGAIVFGKMSSPIMRGNLKIFDLRIPELYTLMNEAIVNLSGKNIGLDVKHLMLNGSDLNITARTDIEPRDVFTVSRLDLSSRLIDIDKLMQVIGALSKYTTSSNNNEPLDIPLLLQAGNFSINELKTGAIKADGTTGKISLRNNNLFIQGLKTHTFDGEIDGDIIVNIPKMQISAKNQGSGLNVEKALKDLANVTNALTGTASFSSDLVISGSTVEEIMKNLKGGVTFTVEDGQLGPFGKLENMIMAENIRESKFFQTALGGIINNLATIDTSHFKTMDGIISFENGIAHIIPIVTTGNVMSLHIAGDFNLLENSADMKVRAKLGSVIANLLGPLSQLNPINLVQATPGLNVVMAKTFFLFCETLTPEETAQLPHLETPLDDKMATKFQIVLRGDVSKPLKLIKSFKWLALASEIDSAKNFVNTLPDPSIVDDPNATLEEILKAQEEKAKEDAKLKNKIKRIFIKETKE